MGAQLSSGWLCGTMFGLPLFRHRFFWAGDWFWLQPCHAPHRAHIRGTLWAVAPARSSSTKASGLRRLGVAVGHAKGIASARIAMGLDWMTGHEVTQAVPLVYAEFVGKQLLAALSSRVARAPLDTDERVPHGDDSGGEVIP